MSATIIRPGQFVGSTLRGLLLRLGNVLLGGLPLRRRAPRAIDCLPIRASHTVMVIGLGLIVLAVAVSSYAISNMRNQMEASYHREIANLGTVLAEQTSRYVQQIDLVLGEVRDHAAALGVRTPDQFRQWMLSAEARGYMRGRLENMAQVAALIAADSNGREISSTGPVPSSSSGVADLDFFRHVADRDAGGLFISERLRGWSADAPSVIVARAVRAPDRTFLGVVAAAIDVAALDGFYRSINTQRGMSVTLLRRDGLTLIREPDSTHDVGTWISRAAPWYSRVAAGGGDFWSPGFLGGPVPALVSVHPLTRYPLVVDVSIKRQVALDAWRQQSAMISLAGIAAVAGFALLAWMIAALFQHKELQQAALRKSETSLAQKSLLLQTTLDHMDQGLIMIGTDRTVPVCNRRAAELLDLPQELLGSRPAWDDVIAYQQQIGEFANASPALQDTLRRSLQLDGPLAYDRERPNGRVLEVRTVFLSDGAAVRTYTDITERKRAEERATYLAHHDGLTGLANRVLLRDRLTQAIEYTRREGKLLAVLVLDLDHFKEINDSYGHAAGDQVLQDVAKRVRQTVRAADTVARTGGDEFVVVQTGATQPNAAVGLAERLVEALLLPFFVGDRKHVVGASIGIALCPADGDTPSDLLKNADIALYRAKMDGRGAFRLFEAEMDRQLRERRDLENDLGEAIRGDQLGLDFQPQFACNSGAITGFEALVRWRHPKRGTIPPSIFVPIAEESRLILDLGAWVLQRACVEAASWPEPHRVAVNLSAGQFGAGDLAAQVADILHSTGLPASRLELEVTESLLIHHPDRARAALTALKRMGVRIALDDFGTGYSSLSYLRIFPFDKIKIDQSFVQALTDDPSARSIVQSILAMSRSLKLEVIAEGVETEQQLHMLSIDQCTGVQGFLLGKPMPSSEVHRYLQLGVRNDLELAGVPR